MLFLLGGVAVLAGFLFLVYLFINADPVRLARNLKWTGIAIAAFAVLGLLVLPPVRELAGLMLPLAMSMPLLSRLRGLIDRWRAPRSGQSSTDGRGSLCDPRSCRRRHGRRDQRGAPPVDGQTPPRSRRLGLSRQPDQPGSRHAVAPHRGLDAIEKREAFAKPETFVIGAAQARGPAIARTGGPRQRRRLVQSVGNAVIADRHMGV